MSTLARRDGTTGLARRFPIVDDLVEEWLRSLPMRRPFGLAWDWPGEDLIRVDEFRDGTEQVIRAEMPGLDPTQDIDLTLTDGMLRIKAERRIDEKSEDKGYLRREMRYGSLTRTLPLPEGVQDTDIAATYRNGILEIRFPVPEQPAETEPTKIAIKA